LGVTVADHLYQSCPDMPEGRMTRLRAELVCEQSLFRVAQNLGLGADLRLGKGEEHNGGRTRPSILSDAVEAIIAALYLDAGMDEARRFVLEKVLGDVEISEQRRSADYKTRLQELVQRKANQHIAYELVSESGPDHNKLFEFEVRINGVPSGRGSGRTKKEAEQMAACKALEAMAE
jgi:ribonuclease-3